MIRDNDQKTEKGYYSYEDYGFDRLMVKPDAPFFQEEPMTYKKTMLGDLTATTIGNIGSGTVLRGSLANRAKASPFVIQVVHYPVQINAPVSLMAANLLVAISGPNEGNPNYIDGYDFYGDFPIKDRTASHNSTYTPKGVCVDSNGVWIAEGTHLYKMPFDFSSITEITPSGSALPSINGLASDNNKLYTTNGDTTLYTITVSGTTYTYTQSTLSFKVSKMGSYTGKLFLGYDSDNKLIKEWLPDKSLWRSISYAETGYCGLFPLLGFVYVANQLSNSNLVNLTPILI